MTDKQKEREEKKKSLVVNILSHCEIDKKGRLYDATGKAGHFLEYLKSLCFREEVGS